MHVFFNGDHARGSDCAANVRPLQQAHPIHAGMGLKMHLQHTLSLVSAQREKLTRRAPSSPLMCEQGETSCHVDASACLDKCVETHHTQHTHTHTHTHTPRQTQDRQTVHRASCQMARAWRGAGAEIAVSEPPHITRSSVCVTNAHHKTNKYNTY